MKKEFIEYKRGCGCKLRAYCVFPWVSYESTEGKWWTDIVYSHFSERDKFRIDYDKCNTAYDYCFPEHLFDYFSSRLNVILLNKE